MARASANLFLLPDLTRPFSLSTFGQFLTSGLLWRRYMSWSRAIYSPLPFKLYLASVTWSAGLWPAWAALEAAVRRRLIDAECELVEFSMPIG